MKKKLNLFLVIVIFFGCNADNTTQPGKDTTPPTVSITSPANNGSVLDSTLIVVNASDNIAVEKVEIYIDGNLVCTRSTVPWQYEWNMRNLSLNTVHTIMAKAYDAANNVGTSQTISVTVNWTDTTPPSVSITSPTNNSNVTDSTLIVVNASDNVGIKKVEFYIDGSLSRTISTVPWQYNWDVRGLSPNSTHTILAKAYDTANNIGTSGTITVTIHITSQIIFEDHFDNNSSASNWINTGDHRAGGVFEVQNGEFVRTQGGHAFYYNNKFSSANGTYEFKAKGGWVFFWRGTTEDSTNGKALAIVSTDNILYYYECLWSGYTYGFHNNSRPRQESANVGEFLTDSLNSIRINDVDSTAQIYVNNKLVLSLVMSQDFRNEGIIEIGCNDQPALTAFDDIIVTR